MKADDCISWSEFFMGVAELAAKRSKDPNTKVGACIVNGKNHILSTGYNGMPIGCDDDQMPWEREGSFEDSKYAYVCHAELNAILNSNGRSLEGSILYVTNFPCNECAKAIIQAGIKKVIFKEDKYPSSDITRVSKGLLKVCGIDVVSYANGEYKSVETLFFGDGTPPKKIYRDRDGNIVDFDSEFGLPQGCLNDIDGSGYDTFVGLDRAPEYEDRKVTVKTSSVVDGKISINLNSDFIPPGMSNEDLLKQLAKKHLRERSHYER